MAITKIQSVRTSISQTLKYCMTKKGSISSGINCIANLDIATKQFQDTKERFGKGQIKDYRREGKIYKNRVGYHAVQSFKPGEISAEKAHEIGLELAQKMWGDRYEVIVSTHTDRQHIHNHFVINSVSFIDGKKMHFPKQKNNSAMNKEMAELSDAICLKNGLDTIIVESRISYADFGKYSLENKSSIRDSIKKDIDNLLFYHIKDLDELFSELEKIGYEVKLDRKYPSIKPPYAERFIRLQSLGKNYTLEGLYDRVFENKQSLTYKTGAKDYYLADVKWKIYISNLKSPPGSLINLIRHYQIFLKKYQNKPLVYSSPEARASAERIKDFNNEISFLQKNNFDSLDNIKTFRWEAQQLLADYNKERNQLYLIKKEDRSSDVIININRLSMQIRELRKEVQLAKTIVKDVDNLNIRNSNELFKEKEKMDELEQEYLSSKRDKKDIKSNEKNELDKEIEE